MCLFFFYGGRSSFLQVGVGVFSRLVLHRAVAAGMKRPVLSLPAPSEQYPLSNLVYTLGALHALYVVSFRFEFRFGSPNESIILDSMRSP